jgi:hypothetical protein
LLAEASDRAVSSLFLFPKEPAVGEFDIAPTVNGVQAS